MANPECHVFNMPVGKGRLIAFDPIWRKKAVIDPPPSFLGNMEALPGKVIVRDKSGATHQVKKMFVRQKSLKINPVPGGPTLIPNYDE